MLSSPYYYIQGTSICNDLNGRLNIHDPYVSLYSFWWTSSIYLSSFLWLIITGVVLGFTSRSVTYLTTTLSIIGLLLTEIYDFIILNKGWGQSNYVCDGLNNLLLNTLNHYHPFILYSSFAVLTVVFLMGKAQEFYVKSYSYTLYENSNQTLSRTSLVISVIALLLGSWWAAQEGTWGGWWNWDTSEVLGWLISLYTLVLVHSLGGCKNALTTRYKKLVLWKGIVSLYLLVQISFELTAHNFGIKFFYFFNSNLFLLESLSYISILIVYSLNMMLHYNNPIWTWLKISIQHKRESYLFQSFIRWLLVMSTSAIIILSSKPLLSYLTWTFMTINYSTVWITSSSLSFSVIFYMYVLLLHSYSSNKLINCFYFVISCCWPWTLVTQLRLIKLLYVEHWFILLFVTLNWVIFFYDFSYWNSRLPTASLLFTKPLCILQHKVVLVDAQMLEHVYEGYTLFEKYTENWLTLSDINSASLNTFALELKHSSIWNLYHLSETYVFTTLYIELPFTSYLTIIATVLVSSYMHL